MKHGKLFKTLTALLAGAMLLATGCTPAKSSSTGTASGGDKTSSTEEKAYYNKTGYPICDTTIKLTAASSFSSTAKNFKQITTGTKDNLSQLKYYAEHLGLEFTVDNYTSDAWATTLTNMIAANTLPDMVFGPKDFKLSDANKYGDQGFILDLMQYKELLPNLLAVNEKYPDLLAVSQTSDGKLYATGALANPFTADATYRTFLNKKYIDNLKIEIPKTIDEYTAMLKRFRDEDADGDGDKTNEVPLDYKYCNTMTDRLLMGTFGVTSNNSAFPLHEGDDGKVTMLDDHYKEFLRYLTMLYEEGLMDKNAFSISNEESNAQIAADKVGAYAHWAPFVAYSTDSTEDINLAYGYMSLSSQYNGNQQLVVLNPTVSDTVRAFISTKTQYPEACVRFYDFLFTEDGNTSVSTGVPTEVPADLYEVKHDAQLNLDFFKGNTDKIPAIYEKNWDGFRSAEIMMNGNLKMADIPYDGAQFPNSFEPLIKFFKSNPSADAEKTVTTDWNQEALRAKAIAYTDAKTVNAYPTMNYGDDTTRRSQLKTDISSAITDAKSTVIIGGTANFDANWKKMVDSANGMGVEELLKIEQTHYDAYKANLK